MFILASASPRRTMLLQQVCCDFKVVISDWCEETVKSAFPKEIVQQNALGKALDVAARTVHDDSIVIGADTVVVFAGQVFGKPKSQQEAVAMLEILSGNVHSVLTGIAVVRGKDVFSEVVETKVHVKKLSATEIRNYVMTGEPEDKAGAYAIQGRGALLVEKIEGCYSNVVGLPLVQLDKMLRKMGCSLL